MATLTIRNLPEPIRRSLKERAAAHNRSMEAEVRSILEQSVAAQPNFIDRWIASAESLRGDLELPARTMARPVDLS